MIRLNYRSDGEIISKKFDNLAEAYEFAIRNVATLDDRKYYYFLCGESFRSVIRRADVDKRDALMWSILKNSLERVTLVCEEKSS